MIARRNFSPIDVVNFLKGTEGSDAALAARWEGDKLTGYSIFRFQGVGCLVDAGKASLVFVGRG